MCTIAGREKKKEEKKKKWPPVTNHPSPPSHATWGGKGWDVTSNETTNRRFGH
jgi:hypothetical protein